jgi:hypothetical protein
VNLDYVDFARLEEPHPIFGAEIMNLKAMSLGELLYFALVKKMLPDLAAAT